MSIPFPNGTIEGLIQQGSVGWFRDEDTQCVVVAVMGKLVILAPVSEVCLGFPADIEDFTLDLNNKTSRFHARLWLAERGHDVGNEDRAEVLSWSVLSVHRGGKPLLGVAARWTSTGGGGFARQPDRFYDDPRCDLGSGWRISWRGVVRSGRQRGAEGRAAADAALLAMGWALTNDDRSLTLPPLPQ